VAGVANGRGAVVGGLVLSLVPILHLHVVSADQLDPVVDVISDYVFVRDGAGWLAAAALTLAATSGVLAWRLSHVTGWARWLLTAWAAGLTVATIFPTDPAGEATSFSGHVHRCAAAVMFVCLPAAGLLIARRFPVLTGIAVTATASSAAFLASHVSSGGSTVRGLTERLLFATLYGLLFAVAGLPRRTT
jgi:hypothetical protein